MNRVIFAAIMAGGLFSLMWQLPPRSWVFWIVGLLCNIFVAICKW